MSQIKETPKTSQKNKLTDFQVRLSQKKSDSLVTVSKALLFAFVVFTFLSGLVFTVIPLANNVINHIQWHIIDPVNRWIAAEPATGGALLLLFQITGTMIVLYMVRDYVRLLWLIISTLVGKLKKKLNESINRMKERDKQKEKEKEQA